MRQDSATGPESVDLFVGRIAANVLEESSVGLIVTSGNPDANVDNSLAGVDFRYLNTRLGEDRVLEATAWYQKTDTEGLGGDDSAYGVSFEMPNSEGWRGEVGFKALEENYFPALGFASRTDFTATDADIGYTWRPQDNWIRRIESGIEGEFVNAINGRDQSAGDRAASVAEVENQAADILTLAHYLVEERLDRALRDFGRRRHSRRHLPLRPRLRDALHGRAALVLTTSRPSATAISTTGASSCSRRIRPGGRART